MTTFFSKLEKSIFKDRIKPFLIIEVILGIASSIIGFYGLKDHRINHFYVGLGQLIFAGFWFVIGIEHLLLKKKMYFAVCLLGALVFVYIAIDSFSLVNVKQ
ncbi:hypothetical protein [Neobacillus drentensis]|jgi:hypothetical protein|uniref:hypothetical protein n=1 Tax=Neobacillus drentensis TaxID=220684 RepID=UPI0030006515